MHLIFCRPRHQKQIPTVRHILKKIASTAAKDNQFNRAQVGITRKRLQPRPDQHLRPKRPRLCANNSSPT